MTRGGRLLPLVIGTIGLIACGGLVLLLTYRHNLRIDLTPERNYTLSTQARKILTELPQDVRLTVFVRSEDARTPQLKDLLYRIGQITKRVSYEFVDLNRSPALAKRYGIDRYGAIVVESGGRRRDVSNPTESLLMGAMLGVTRERQRTVRFVVGHGERSPDDGDRETGMSAARRILEDEHFSIKTLPLVGEEGIPPDTAVLVIAGPRKDYLPGELARVEAYLRRGGALLLLLDPEAPGSIVDFAARLGVLAPDQVIVDPEQRLAGGEGVTLMVPDLLPSFLVSASLEAPPVVSTARPLEVTEAMKDAAIRFLKTGPASYAAPPGDVRQPARGSAGGGLLAGVALVSQEGRNGRVIVLGDSDFAVNRYFDYLGNKDLLLNGVNWLARDESLLAARAQTKQVGREQFFVTKAQGAWAFWLATVVQPLVFFAAGTLAFVRRQRR